MCNVSKKIIQAAISICSVSLPPHEFINVGWQLIVIRTSHFLELDLYTVPVAFNVLCVDIGNRIHKVKGMIHDSMSCNIRQLPNSCSIG